jgi:hypothetical protein
LVGFNHGIVSNFDPKFVGLILWAQLIEAWTLKKLQDGRVVLRMAYRTTRGLINSRDRRRRP